jgi:hypothetical protein
VAAIESPPAICDHEQHNVDANFFMRREPSTDAFVFEGLNLPGDPFIQTLVHIAVGIYPKGWDSMNV